ncbi:MAG: hypothetical protein HY719_18010 [Planctomycetes bacterium]|nr:hypothetical protein [Planctomycetota bacterium]
MGSLRLASPLGAALALLALVLLPPAARGEDRLRYFPRGELTLLAPDGWSALPVSRERMVVHLVADDGRSGELILGADRKAALAVSDTKAFLDKTAERLAERGLVAEEGAPGPAEVGGSAALSKSFVDKVSGGAVRLVLFEREESLYWFFARFPRGDPRTAAVVEKAVASLRFLSAGDEPPRLPFTAGALRFEAPGRWVERPVSGPDLLLRLVETSGRRVRSLAVYRTSADVESAVEFTRVLESKIEAKGYDARERFDVATVLPVGKGASFLKRAATSGVSVAAHAYALPLGGDVYTCVLHAEAGDAEARAALEEIVRSARPAFAAGTVEGIDGIETGGCWCDRDGDGRVDGLRFGVLFLEGKRPVRFEVSAPYTVDALVRRRAAGAPEGGAEITVRARQVAGLRTSDEMNIADGDFSARQYLDLAHMQGAEGAGGKFDPFAGPVRLTVTVRFQNSDRVFEASAEIPPPPKQGP